MHASEEHMYLLDEVNTIAVGVGTISEARSAVTIRIDVDVGVTDGSDTLFRPLAAIKAQWISSNIVGSVLAISIWLGFESCPSRQTARRLQLGSSTPCSR
jgi:hypothetical protein